MKLNAFLILFIFPLFTIAQKSFQQCEIAHYQLNNNTQDSGPNGLHGIANNVIAIAGRDAPNLSGYEFNGTTSHIDCGNSTVYNEPWPALSISAWFKKYQGISNQQMIAGKWGFNQTVDRFALFCFDNNVEFWVCDGVNSEPGIKSLNGFNDNEWTHAVGVWSSNGEIKLYVNNVLVASQSNFPVTSLNQNGNTNFFIGRQLDGKDRPFHGIIDDVRIFGCALSENDVQTLFNDQPIVIDTSQLPVDPLPNDTTSFLFPALDIQLYPVPTRDRLVIKSSISISKVELFNVLGQQIPIVSVGKNELLFGSFSPGTYSLRFYGVENQYLTTKKITFIK